MTPRALPAAAVLLLPLALPVQAQEPDYIELCGGTSFATGRSNTNPIEFGGEPGGLLCGIAGLSYELDTAWTLHLEGGFREDLKPLHGRNNGDLHQSADGDQIVMSTFTAGAGIEYRLVEDLHLYLRGGLGGALVHGLSDQDFAPAAQASAGVRYQLSSGVSLTLGYGVATALGVDLDGYVDDITLHSPIIGVRVQWGQ